jgi:hypothetical protein
MRETTASDRKAAGAQWQIGMRHHVLDDATQY